MKRKFTALTISLALSLATLAALLVGLGGRLPVASAHSATVDGSLNDWITTFPNPPTNNGHVMRNSSYEGEFIWTDATGDERTDFGDPAQEDIAQFRLTGDSSNLYFLVKMAGPITTTTGNGAPMVQIAMDLDRDGTGNLSFGGNATTAVSGQAQWEYLATTRFGTSNMNVRVWNESWTASYAGSTSISGTAGLIEMSIPWSSLGYSKPPTLPVRFTVAMFRANLSDDVWWIGGNGNGAVDAITTQSGNTWNEVSDGDVDYYFDVYFEPDGDPTSPLQISEVYYDATGDDPSNEFVELYNPAQYLAYLDGALLSDEATAGQTEGVYQFPGTALIGTAYAVEPGAYIVVGVDAKDYDSDKDFPDLYWANWETAYGTDNPDIANLARVAGSNDLALGNSGDNMVLRDGSVIGTQAISNTVIDGMNYEGGGGDTAPADTRINDSGLNPSANTGYAVQRDPTRINPDTNNSTIDFEPDDVPTPGFAKGLIDHAIYKRGPSVVAPGQTFNYYIYWQIAGQPAPTAMITDVLPAGVEYIAHTSSRLITLTASTEPTLTWSLGNVPVSTIGKITVTVRLTTNASLPTVLTQTAYIDSRSAVAEGITTNDAFILTTTVHGADLTVDKTGPALIIPGQRVTYTLWVRNIGITGTTDLAITDTLPNYLTYVTDTSGAMPANPTAGVYVWSLGGVQAGQTYSFNLVCNLSHAAPLETVLTNTVQVATSDAEDSTANNEDKLASTVRGADLTVDKTGPSLVAPGQQVTYTLWVRNIGITGTTDLAITDTLPNYMTYATDTSGATPANPVAGVYIWNLGGVQAGQTYSFNLVCSLTTTVPFGTVLTNTVQVATSDAENSTTNNQDELASTVGGPDLVIAKLAPAAAAPGQVISFSLGVVNRGTSAAHDVWISDTLPGLTTYYTDSQGGAIHSGQVYSWYLGTLNPSDGIAFTVAVTVSSSAHAGAVFTNTARAFSAEPDQNPTDNITWTRTIITGPNPYAYKAAAATILFGGERATYTLTYGNNGTAAAAGVILTDELPTGFTYVADTSGFPANVNGNVITWSLGTLNAGVKVSFTLVATVTTGTPINQGTLVTNVVSISPGGLGNDPADDRGQASSTVYQLVSIATARAGSNGQRFAIEGTVSVEPGIFKESSNPNRKMYIQDNTAGILVYRAAQLAPVDRSHKVRVFGTMDEYRAEREFVPANTTDVFDMGLNTPVVPVLTNTGAIDEPLEGQLVQIIGQITSKPTSYILQVNDGSGMVEVYRYYNLGQTADPNYIDLTPYAVGDYVRVTGVTRGYDYSGVIHREVLPRGPADIAEYPRVLNVSPTNGATDVAVGTNVTATFNLTMTNANATTFLLNSAAGPVAGAVTYDAGTRTATFNPDADLANATRYTATLKANMAASNGMTLTKDYVWAFTTHVLVPNLSISKTVKTAQTPAHLGDVVTYTVILPNTGDGAATGVVMTDPLPSGLTFGGFVLANGATQTGGTVTWSGNVAATSQQQIIFTATVNTDYSLYSQTLVNTATFRSGNAGSGSDQASFTIAGAPALDLVKSVQVAQTPVQLSDVVTYTLTLANSGASEASGVVLTDVLPSGLTFGNFVLANGAIEASGTVTWTGNVAATSQQQVVFTAIVNTDYALYGQTITNTATFRSDNAGSGSDQAAFIVTGAPGLALTKAVEVPQTPVQLGDVVTYTLTLANSGASKATGVVLTDSLPSGLTFGGFALANGATQTGGMVTWTGSLAAAGQQQVIFTATVNMDYDLYGQTITNTATFHSDNAGSGSDQAAFTLIGAPGLTLVKTVAPSADVPLGGSVTYTLTLANSGASEATGVVLTDVLPSGVTFGGFVLANGATETGGMVTWAGSLAAAGQQQIVFTATLGSDTALYGQTITNTATFNSDNAGSGSHKVAFTVVQVTEPSVSAAKTSSADGQVMPGDRVTYTLLLTNTGGVNATVYITDHLGSYYTVYDALDLTESPTGTLTWSGVVTAGQSVALHFVVQVKGLANLPSGLTDLGNSAMVYDGVHTPFHVSDPSAPWVRVYNVYLPIMAQNYQP